MADKYVSDHTRFISELKAKNPQIEQGQLEGRALLWDKVIDRETQRRYQAARVPQQGYVYQNDVAPAPAEKAGG